MDDLTGEFVSETREMLERVGEALVAWEADPTDCGRLDEIFRFVHTVKGSCGFLDLPRIEALAHAAESALAQVRAGDRVADAALVSAMLAVIDRITLQVEALDPASPNIAIGDDDTRLVAKLALGAGAVKAATRDPEAEPEPEPEIAALASVAPARTIRIAVPLLESLMDQVSELVLVRNELMRHLRDADAQGEFQGCFDRLSTIVGDLRESVTRTRMQPIEKLFSVLPRLVRDTAAELGKQVVLEIAGQDVEIDREMVEAIRDPLIHVVRNAIDHGIEAPAVRIADGKPTAGLLRVIAAQSGNQVSIEISDDGRGIDIARLKERAVAARLIDTARAALLDDEAAAALIFEAGLSTSTTITTISGRGVGMDIVRANVERLGGSVHLANRPGAGLALTLRAPLTLSIVTGLVVTAGGQPFAIPRSAIEEVVALGASTRFEKLGDDIVAVLRDTTLPAFVLAHTLGLQGARPLLAVVVATPDGRRYALGVDSIVGQEELVVRPTAPQLAGLGLFAGQALSDTGQPLVILDPIGLAHHAGLDRSTTIVKSAAMPEGALERPSALFATGLDGSALAVRAALVERIIEIDRSCWFIADDSAFAIFDGAHIPARLIGALPDAGRTRVLLIGDGVRRMALPVQAVRDLAPIPDATLVDDPRAEGLLLVDGISFLLLDGFWLLGCAALPQRASRPKACIALDPGPWAIGLLAPALEAAGYDVRFGDVEGAALVFHVEGDDPPLGSIGRPVALLKSDRGGVATERYDRTSLMKLIAGSSR